MFFFHKSLSLHNIFLGMLQVVYQHYTFLILNTHRLNPQLFFTYSIFVSTMLFRVVQQQIKLIFWISVSKHYIILSLFIPGKFIAVRFISVQFIPVTVHTSTVHTNISSYQYEFIPISVHTNISSFIPIFVYTIKQKYSVSAILKMYVCQSHSFSVHIVCFLVACCLLLYYKCVRA